MIWFCTHCVSMHTRGCHVIFLYQLTKLLWFRWFSSVREAVVRDNNQARINWGLGIVNSVLRSNTYMARMHTFRESGPNYMWNRRTFLDMLPRYLHDSCGLSVCISMKIFWMKNRESFLSNRSVKGYLIINKRVSYWCTW